MLRADSYAFRTLSRSSSSWSARSMYGLALLAASETRSVVLAIVGGSFRLLARAFLPPALLFILAACGGSAKPEAPTTRLAHGPDDDQGDRNKIAYPYSPASRILSPLSVFPCP